MNRRDALKAVGTSTAYLLAGCSKQPAPVSEAPMADATSLINRMDRWLAANRPAYYALLQPGLGNAALDAFENRFSLKLPEAFRDLYRWRNGQTAGSSAPLQQNRTYEMLEEITRAKTELDSLIGSDFDDPKYWRRGWVPFLHNGAGSWLCLDLAAEDGGQIGQLVAFWKRDEDRPVEHPSVEAWLAALVTSMENGSLELS
jgi:cell wall assembly regulator SMI1